MIQYLYVNEAWLTFCSFALEDVIGRTDFELFDPDFAEGFVRNDRLVAETAQTIQVEERAPKHGTVAVAVSTKFPLRDSAGSVVAVGGIAVDITEKHKAQVALEASELRYRALIEHSPEAFVVLGINAGCFVEANENAERLFALPKTDILRASPADLSPPTQADGRPSLEAAGEYIGAALRGETPVFDWLHRAGTGELIPCRIWLARVELEDGPGVRASILDMREIVRIRSNLERTRAQLDAVQDALPQVVVVYEPSTSTMAHCNRTYLMLSPAAPLWEVAREACDHALRTGVGHQEVDLVTSHGEKRRFVVDASVFGRETVETPRRLLLVGSDVTQQRRMDAELRESRRLESLGRLAGGVAHDFNNLLTVILASTEFLDERLQHDSEGRADLALLVDAAERAKQITTQLLTFARSRRGNEEPLVLDQQIADSMLLLRRMVGEEMAVIARLGVPSHRVLIDRGQFEQVLFNLTANARDAMEPGGTLTIETRLHRGSERTLELRFTDTGTGMSQDTIDKAFDPFFTTKTVGRGTGLGLSTVHGIVETAGGHVSIISSPGAGTSIVIVLPISGEECGVDASASQSTEPQPSTAPPSADERVNGRHLKVLLVEDEAAVLTVNQRAVQAAGHAVTVAPNGVVALQLLKTHGPFDVIVTDVVMPLMSGFELADRVRSEFPEQKFVFVSGYAEDVLAGRGLGDSDVEILQKPFSPVVLLERIRAIE